MMHIKNSVILSLKNELFKEMFKMSSAAAQQASMKAHRTRSVAGPNPTQPVGQPNPRTTPLHGLALVGNCSGPEKSYIFP